MAYEIWHMAKVLHVLDHSLPYFSGYSFRSDYIISAQRRLGLRPVVVTSPRHEDFERKCETVDGVDYHRLRWSGITCAAILLGNGHPGLSARQHATDRFDHAAQTARSDGDGKSRRRKRRGWPA